jgi:CRISPR/Cas system-associated exonuclease Cas4 (RecB family)
VIFCAYAIQITNSQNLPIDYGKSISISGALGLGFIIFMAASISFVD